MKLTIDCFKLEKGMGKSIGIYVYTASLIKELVRQAEGKLDITVLGNCRNKSDFAVAGVEFIEIPYNHRNKLVCIWWELLGVIFYMNKTNCDKIFFPRGYIPLFKHERTVVTIHDMIPFYYHETYPTVLNRFENFYIMRRLKVSARKAGVVFTISEGAGEQIYYYTGVPEERIHVIHSGITEKMEAVEDEQVREITKNPYIMAITSNLPHKNPVGILQTYIAYWNSVERPYKIFIAGMKDPKQYIPDIADEVAQDIICGKYLKDTAFNAVMQRASCLLFLSRIEGLGYPPLEAMQWGVPVVVSDIPVMREVVGNAGIYVPTNRPEEAASALRKLLDNPARQKELVQLGYENLKRFDWKEQIKQYIEVLTSE